MTRFRPGRPSPGLVVATVALVIALGGSSYAALAGSSSSIVACVHHKGGAMYVARGCARHDKRLTWNIAGPGGPQGPQGDKGVPGIPGTPGGRGPAGPTFGAEAFATLGTAPPTFASVNVIATGSVSTPAAGSLYVYGHFSPVTNATCSTCTILTYALYVDGTPVPGSAVRRHLTQVAPVSLSGVLGSVPAGTHEIAIGFVADAALATLGSGDASAGAVLLGS